VAGIKLAHGNVQWRVLYEIGRLLFTMHKPEIRCQLNDYQFPKNHSASCML
jgi:hypothetical protein